MALVVSSQVPTATTDNIHSKSSLQLYSCVRNYCENIPDCLHVQQVWLRADRQRS